MGFPKAIVECAFNNSSDETLYATQGWAEITPWVDSMSGTLRGRSHEREEGDAGTLTVTLDNTDGEFTPGNPTSPFYPNIKANRRFRVRGKNMVAPNLGRGGGADHSAMHFERPSWSDDLAIFSDIFDRVTSSTWGGNWVNSGGSASNYSTDGSVGLHTIDTLGTSRRSVLMISQADVDVTVTVTIPVAATGANIAAGLASRYIDVNNYYYAEILTETTGVVNLRTQKVVSGTTTALSTVNTGATHTAGDSYRVRMRIVGTSIQVKAWKLGTTEPGSWTATYTDSGLTAAGGVGIRTAISTGNTNGTQSIAYDDFSVTLPNSTMGVSEPVWVQHSPATYPILPTALTDHIQVTLAPGTYSGLRRLVSWLVPLEVGVRLTHSAYIWRVSGTEAVGGQGRFEVFYYDNNDIEQVSAYSMTRPITIYNLPTSTTPTRYALSHAPVGVAKYARVVWSVDYGSGVVATDPIVYGLTGLQSELPSNLAPNPNGDWDALHWLGRGGSETATTSGVDVGLTWGGSVSLYQTIPHLVPGRTYAATVTVKLPAGHGPVIFTADEGATGDVVSTTGSFVIAHCSWVAEAPDETVEIMMADGSTPVAGAEVRVAGLNVQEVADPLTLLDPEGLDPKGTTAWERPLDVFEGWVERWPWKVDENESTITVVDRLKRVGSIELANVVSETLSQDIPVLVVPFNDDPTNNIGTVTWYGSWAQESETSSVAITPSKGDILTATYALGEEGPTEEPAIDWLPASNAVGYYVKVPYSPDYSAPPPVTPKPPPSAPPPPPATKKTYTKVYYATWSRSYDSDGGTRFDDSPYLYHGCYFCSNNQRALVGFNWSAIKSDLSGADIVSVYYTMKNAHARWNNGLDVNIGTHTYSGKPGSWSGSSVSENRWKSRWDELQKKSLGLPVSVGNEFKAGTTKGIAVGPAPSNITDNYGYFYGATQSNKPYLTITYKK